jgi:L-ornithine N5-oxygenase
MSAMADRSDEPTLDVLGVGFGPSSLALCAVSESRRYPEASRKRRICCLERRPGFAWHPDMLIDGSRMQVAFLKDLASAVDPTSPYSFVNYLHEHGRLEHFVNLQTFFPSRQEFHDYLAWAARQLSSYVRYRSTVEAIRPILASDGRVSRLRVVYHDDAVDQRRSVIARNVVVAAGGRPALPPGISPATLDDALFHSDSFLSRIQRFERDGARERHEFLVIGAGQSAGEVFQHLAHRFPAARVTLAFRGFALMPANNSAHANEIFNAEMVDLFYGLPDSGKSMVLGQLRHTNYAAVDEIDIEMIASMLYEQRVAGTDRLDVHRFSEIVACERQDSGVVAHMRDVHTGQMSSGRYTAVVLATGYDFGHAHGLLADLEPHIQRDAAGAIVMERDYSIRTDDSVSAKIFLQGATERTHGLTSTLISVMAQRAAEILDSAFAAAEDVSDLHDAFAPRRARTGDAYPAILNERSL